MRCIIDDLRRILDDNIYGILEMRVNIMKKIAFLFLTIDNINHPSFWEEYFKNNDILTLN